MIIPIRILTGLGLAITASFTGWQGLQTTDAASFAAAPAGQQSCSTSIGCSTNAECGSSIDCSAGEVCVICVEPCDFPECIDACDLNCVGPCDAECLEQCELQCDFEQACAEPASCSQAQECSK